jgi:cysteine desulfuration protein SufE
MRNMDIDELIENFALFDDWEARYEYLIDLGRRLPPMDDALKTETAKVSGCMSQVWMVLGWDGQGRLNMAADSDAQIVRGLIAVLHVLFDGKTGAQIAQIDVNDVFARLGLDQHMSPNRRNGFFSMVENVRRFTSRCT